tara:strand:- start:442 stop:663 length:222 start_codon:yes stop_codon:yes gene_type:complete
MEHEELRAIAPHCSCSHAEVGIFMDEIARYLGHSDSRITAPIYARDSPEHIRKAANVLEFSQRSGSMNLRTLS